MGQTTDPRWRAYNRDLALGGGGTLAGLTALFVIPSPYHWVVGAVLIVSGLAFLRRASRLMAEFRAEARPKT